MPSVKNSGTGCEEVIMKFLRVIVLGIYCIGFSVSAYAASSVYIPGVPSAGSSSIGITCQANFPGAGCLYCFSASPGPLISSGGAVTITGFSNRLIFAVPGSYGWSVPAGVTKMLAVVIGGGGGGGTGGCPSGGGGGGYAQKLYTVAGGNAVSVSVGNSGAGGAIAGSAGSSGGTSSISIAGVIIQAAGGGGGAGAGYVAGNGGCGSSGDINTCGGTGSAAVPWCSGRQRGWCRRSGRLMAVVLVPPVSAAPGSALVQQ